MTRMLDLQITGKCNLNCKFCCGAPRDIKCADFEDVKKVVDKLAAVNVERIVITGGEPLMRKKDLIRICEENPECLFISFTNGTLVDDAF